MRIGFLKDVRMTEADHTEPHKQSCSSTLSKRFFTARAKSKIEMFFSRGYREARELLYMKNKLVTSIPTTASFFVERSDG